MATSKPQNPSVSEHPETPQRADGASSLSPMACQQTLEKPRSTAAMTSALNAEELGRGADVRAVGGTKRDGGKDAVDLSILATSGELFWRGGEKELEARQAMLRWRRIGKGGADPATRRRSAVYEWAEGGGMEMIRRQGLMDKAGAVRD